MDGSLGTNVSTLDGSLYVDVSLSLVSLLLLASLWQCQVYRRFD